MAQSLSDLIAPYKNNLVSALAGGALGAGATALGTAREDGETDESLHKRQIDNAITGGLSGLALGSVAPQGYQAAKGLLNWISPSPEPGAPPIPPPAPAGSPSSQGSAARAAASVAAVKAFDDKPSLVGRIVDKVDRIVDNQVNPYASKDVAQRDGLVGGALIGRRIGGSLGQRLNRRSVEGSDKALSPWNAALAKSTNNLDAAKMKTEEAFVSQQRADAAAAAASAATNPTRSLILLPGFQSTPQPAASQPAASQTSNFSTFEKELKDLSLKDSKLRALAESDRGLNSLNPSWFFRRGLPSGVKSSKAMGLLGTLGGAWAGRELLPWATGFGQPTK